MTQFSSRKFVLAFCTLATSSGLVIVGVISDTTWATVVGTVILAYITGNVAQKATSKETP